MGKQVARALSQRSEGRTSRGSTPASPSLFDLSRELRNECSPPFSRRHAMTDDTPEQKADDSHLRHSALSHAVEWVKDTNNASEVVLAAEKFLVFLKGEKPAQEPK